jgi:hypothetical protein
VQLLHNSLFPYKRSWKLTKAFQFCTVNCENGSEVSSVPEVGHSKKMYGLYSLSLGEKKIYANR